VAGFARTRVLLCPNERSYALVPGPEGSLREVCRKFICNSVYSESIRSVACHGAAISPLGSPNSAWPSRPGVADKFRESAISCTLTARTVLMSTVRRVNAWGPAPERRVGRRRKVGRVSRTCVTSFPPPPGPAPQFPRGHCAPCYSTDRIRFRRARVCPVFPSPRVPVSLHCWD